MLYLVFVAPSTREKGNESMYPQIQRASALKRWLLRQRDIHLFIRIFVGIVFIQRPRACANSDHDHFCFTFANVVWAPALCIIVQHHYAVTLYVHHACCASIGASARARLLSLTCSTEREMYEWAGEVFNIGHFLDSKSVLFWKETRTYAHTLITVFFECGEWEKRAAKRKTDLRFIYFFVLLWPIDRTTHTVTDNTRHTHLRSDSHRTQINNNILKVKLNRYMNEFAFDWIHNKWIIFIMPSKRNFLAGYWTKVLLLVTAKHSNRRNRNRKKETDKNSRQSLINDTPPRTEIRTVDTHKIVFI